MEEYVTEMTFKLKANDESEAREQTQAISTKISEDYGLSEVDSSCMPADEYEEKRGQAV